jgi:hypothetical protein
MFIFRCCLFPVLVFTDTILGSKLKNKIADDKPRFLINDVDFLVGYSTLSGSVSYRNEQTASFDLNSLCKNLKDKGEA